MTMETLSIIIVGTVTLPNGEIWLAPTTEEQRGGLPSSIGIQTILAETSMTCGLFDQAAGRFAVVVGFPAKSGVREPSLMVTVPGVFGFFVITKGNSARGVNFCKFLVSCYRLYVSKPF